jgi:hypothetical protein
VKVMEGGRSRKHMTGEKKKEERAKERTEES